MKKILFVYDSMMTGGTSTALLSLINAIDRTKYEISLLLYTNTGQHIKDIPSYVNVLPNAYLDNSRFSSGKRKILRTILNGQIFKALISYFKYKNTPKGNFRNVLMHYGMKAQVSISRDVNEKFDYAIGFMEGWSNQYVASNKIKAKKKFIWIHPQYKSCYLIPEIDKKIFSKVDGIALVSENCVEQFLEFFPEFNEKINVVPNIISTEFVRKKANAESVSVKKARINFCSVSRCDIKVKGLDRILNALHTLKQENLCDGILFHYIGGGNELEAFKTEVERLGLSDVVIIYGNKQNPLPYLLQMDAFVLASRYEGKPVSVTEAQILGLPCIVTNYESASSQVQHNYDGWIMNNSSKDVYLTLKKIITDSSCLSRWKLNVENERFGNENLISDFYRFIEQD